MTFVKTFKSFLCAWLVVFLLSGAMATTKKTVLSWRSVQDKAKDTVVQVLVQSALFNWLQPFKSPDYKKAFGSGFFIDNQGHIISNFHVVEEACGIKIQVPVFGKEQLEARVVGVCPGRDLALLKLTDESIARLQAKLGKIPFLELGDSDNVVRTQEILALGYPLGQERLKSTQGIISGREMVWDESYFQITAPLNPGNSGGPSLNDEGKVIGINTARMKSAHNIGYIIPINDIKSTINDLYKTRLLHTPLLGCEFNYATQQMTQFLKNPLPGGLYIARVHKNTLLEGIGVQEGDMVYALNGHRLDLYGETNVSWSEDKVPVIALLNRFVLGQNISLELYRQGEKKEFSVTFENHAPLPVRQLYPGYEKIRYEIFGGMIIMPLAVNHIELFKKIDIKVLKELIKYEKPEHQQEPKLMVTYVFPTSQAQEARCIHPGDLIAEVNGQHVSTLDEFRKAVKKSIAQGLKNNFITIKTEDKKLMVLSLDQLLADENRLAKQYIYKKTKLVKELCLAFCAP